MTQPAADRMAGRPNPPHPAPGGAANLQTAVAWDLLARTAELPRTKRRLMAVLREYRATLHTLAAYENHSEQAPDTRNAHQPKRSSR